jgi:hypothetical protein
VLGNFDGSMAAGSDGFILTEGSVHGSLSAGRDAYVWAIGNVAGNYHAGRDASLMTYGSYSASLSATRNVGYVWVRGDLVGAVTADGNIGYGPGSYYSTPSDYAIFSYGEIMAVLSAPNGRIGSIGAWNDIEGQIRAGQSIGTIHAGGDVEATIVCPQIGPVVENDTALQTSHPRPDARYNRKLCSGRVEKGGVLWEKVIYKRCLNWQFKWNLLGRFCVSLLRRPHSVGLRSCPR